MEIVVAHPGVDHRIRRHRGLQCRVRVHQRHRHHHAVVAGPDHADAAVRFGHMLHQPVDRVIGVGRVIDLGGIVGAAQRAFVDVFAARSVFATHILIDADIAVGEEHRVRSAHRHVGIGAAVLHRAFGIVGRAFEQYRRVVRALHHHDHGMQLHAVAHRDIDHALDVVEGLIRRREALGHIGREALRPRRSRQQGNRRQPQTRLQHRHSPRGRGRCVPQARTREQAQIRPSTRR